MSKPRNFGSFARANRPYADAARLGESLFSSQPGPEFPITQAEAFALGCLAQFSDPNMMLYIPVEIRRQLEWKGLIKSQEVRRA